MNTTAKKRLVPSLCLFVVALVALSVCCSCEKEDSSPDDTVKQMIVDKWELVRYGTFDESESGTYLEFLANGRAKRTYYSNPEGKQVSEETTYRVADGWSYSSDGSELKGIIEIEHIPAREGLEPYMCSLKNDTLVMCPKVGNYITDPTSYYVRVKE